MKNKIVDKIWAEHDHDKDDNFLYSDGWTDACNRFDQELDSKSIVEWHKVEDKLPKHCEMVLVYGIYKYLMVDGVKSTFKVQTPHEFYNYAMYFEDEDIFINAADVVYKKDEVIAWAYMPSFGKDEVVTWSYKRGSDCGL